MKKTYRFGLMIGAISGLLISFQNCSKSASSDSSAQNSSVSIGLPGGETPINNNLPIEEKVASIFVAKCAICHNSQNPAAGALNATTLAMYVFPFNSSASRLYWALTVTPPYQTCTVPYPQNPACEPKKMPPDSSPQLTPAEIALVGQWIDEGAKLPKGL